MRKIYIFIARAALCLKRRKTPNQINTPNRKFLTAMLGHPGLPLFKERAGGEVSLSPIAKLSIAQITLERLKRRSLIYAAIILLGGYSASAQERLIVGDKVPDVLFSTVLNYKDSTLHFSQLRGKALILDFWATYCSACLKEFPKMDSLQRKYSKNLQIILMDSYSKDTKAILQEFLKERLTATVGFSIPLVQYSDAIHKLFPIESMPHYIWIGGDGRIKAITRADQVTPPNIERLIAGLTLNLRTKKD